VHNPPTGRAFRHHNLTPRASLPLLLRRAPLGALLALTLLLTALNLYAQSGRNKQPTGKPSTGQTRPKRAGANDDAQKPQPSSTPVMRLPGGTVVMDEPPPPPPPAPKVTPTPAPDTAAGEEIGAEDVVRITSNLVTVPASVVDAQGRAVIDLRLEDFELRVDGQPRPISEMSRAEVPVTLALLFDNSQSLTAAREFEKQAAIKFFRSVIRPIDRAAIYSVSTDVVLAQPLTSHIPSLVRTIERFGKPEGATRLHDAIIEAATYLRPYPGRKVIVIVSDGEDTLSDHDFDDALRKTLGADCQVYAVQTKQIEYVMLTGETNNANLQALAAERRMQDLTAHTGGAVYTPLQTSDLDRAFAQISADLSQQYILSYYPTDERGDGRFRTISVRVATRPNMRVRARRGYYPRRQTERFSLHTEPPPPAAVQTVADAGNSATQEAPSQTQSVPALASNIARPERAEDVPARSSRRGPSDMNDEPEAIISAKTIIPEQPPVKKEETRENRSEPTPKPTAASPALTTAPAPVKNSSTPTPTPSPIVSGSTQPQPPKPVSGGVLNGKAISLPKPQYPPSARNMRASGVVTIEVLVDEDGRVVSARAVDGHPALRSSAVAAAREARFTPTVLSGQPVKVVGLITYKFSLAP
jgi:Ca-activated chloride channel family protein